MGRSKHHALDAVFENWHVEVDELADLAPREAKVCEQLRFMHNLKRFHGLQLNDGFPRDDEIQPVPQSTWMPLYSSGNCRSCSNDISRKANSLAAQA
jgi:hypothetical protein